LAQADHVNKSGWNARISPIRGWPGPRCSCGPGQLLWPMWKQCLSFCRRSGVSLHKGSLISGTDWHRRRPAREVVDETVERARRLPLPRAGSGSPRTLHTPRAGPASVVLAGRARRGWRVVTHIAESHLEYEMFAHRRGDVSVASSQPPGHVRLRFVSPVQHMERCGMLGEMCWRSTSTICARRPCVAGGAEGQRGALSAQSRLFRSPPFPLRRLVNAGVNVCLGTDSLAACGNPSAER